MNLHLDKKAFEELIVLTAEYIGIPEIAVRRDYFIVMLLQNLEKSIYTDKCIFKGGTSLSKSYPGTIERFSEDIDITFVPESEMSENQISSELKKIEKIICGHANIEKIGFERSNKSKSSYIWYDDNNKHLEKIKLEIGSSIKPEPFEKRKIKTYIQEYLENNGFDSETEGYRLSEVELYILKIERTFIDKIFAVKRHTLSRRLPEKVRHIYDVVQLYKNKEVKEFIKDKESLKNIVQLTKTTDKYYLEKRNNQIQYNPLEKYNFESWKNLLDDGIKSRYEKLHEELLYTNQKQDFTEVFRVFENISQIMKEIGE